MGLTLDVVPPTSDEGLAAAWRVKESIRRAEGIFQQDRSFFGRAYRRARVYRLRDERADRLAGFAAVRSDGYMLFLAVARADRGTGLGRRLVEAAAEDHPVLTCHVRATNDDAIGFYEHVGFEVGRRVGRYYRDGTDALFMRYDPGPSIA